MYRLGMVILMGSLSLGTAVARSDKDASAPASPTNSSPVHMIVTVEPRKGSDVSAVRPEDVAVYEGKNKDQVVDWIPAQGDHAGLEYFVLIDDGAGTGFDTQLRDIKNFISTLPSNAKVGVAYMQNGIAKIEQNLTTDHAQAAKAVRLPLGYFSANASPYFSLSDLVKRWPQDDARHEVIMITNGYDPYYGAGDLEDPYLTAAIDDCQRAGIVVSAIYAPNGGHLGHSYWLNYWGQNYLAKLTEETGGEGYYLGFTGAAPDFTPYLKDAAERLNHQYLLVFLANPGDKSGLHSVKLRSELHNVDLTSASRVYVPKAQ